MSTFLRLPRRPAGRLLSLLFGALLLFACLPARAEWFAATVEISGTTNNPVFKIINYSSREYDIQTVRIGIGNTAYNFDGANLTAQPALGTARITSFTSESDDRRDNIDVAVTGFDLGDYFVVATDVDPDSGDNVEDYRQVMLGSATVEFRGVKRNTGASFTETLSLVTPDRALSTYTFSRPRPATTLTISSLSDLDAPVRRTKVITNGLDFVDTSVLPHTNYIGSQVTIPLLAGDVVEVRVPRMVYLSITNTIITDSDLNDPDAVANAEERFVANGMRVGDQAQTADPTYYRFEIVENTSISVDWLQEYALTVTHDFTQTQSLDQDGLGRPWAGPLSSMAAGNPQPTASKHWVARNQQQTAEIDGVVLDFSRPGLDVRYVPVAYRSWGPPNTQTTKTADEAKRITQSVDIRTDAASRATNVFTVGQSPPARQRIPTGSANPQPFTMYGPGGITYVWQIQFGVKVNVDDATRASLPAIFISSGNQWIPDYNGDGTFWYDPGVNLRVASRSSDGTGSGAVYLSGWFSGDAHYFSSTGKINTGTGALDEGSPAAQWTSLFTGGPANSEYRGMTLNNLQRAARVQWRYGNSRITTSATIGEYVFQNDPVNKPKFIRQPDRIERISVTPGHNAQVGDMDMAVWDPQAGKLFPLVPGQFRAVWQGTDGIASEVEVTVTYPATPHYPHIANTPPVALDPDPGDDFVFKELKYPDGSTPVIDSQKRFTASTAGSAVLLFSVLQQDSRGQPREYLAVRVVQTYLATDAAVSGGSTAVAIIGRKITDPTLDTAGLGTGYLMNLGARYNPNIYQVSKLEGLAARDVYDKTGLALNPKVFTVVGKDKLPGPIIPVNLNPSSASPPIQIVWYKNPRDTDLLLWPHKVRTYTPQWPTTPAEGLGQIIIASQFGSESRVVVSVNGTEVVADQEVVPAVGNAPAETTYNPSRLQQVQIYSQPDHTKAGYNPNEEHALIAPSLRYADISPRPPAIYALRANDLNSTSQSSASTYTSDPYVLTQFFDTADQEFKMRVYAVYKESPGTGLRPYRFPDPIVLDTQPAQRTVSALRLEPYVKMKAGEPVIPFYPLVEVIGAAPCGQTFGSNLLSQTVYWEDHKGSAWSVSGGTNAWFTHSAYYPLLPDFWWPTNQAGNYRISGTTVTTNVPQVGDCVAFLPKTIRALWATGTFDVVTLVSNTVPTRVLFKSDWPDLAPVLKSGETLTYSGGEFRADHPFIETVVDGALKRVETPGLPAVVAMATAEVVFDSLNPESSASGWSGASTWTARIAQVLDVHRVSLPTGSFPSGLLPATQKTRVKQGKYVFNDLPASLQNRVRYDPLAGRLELFGLVNDKGIGDSTLTASPPAVYILEPNILTADEKATLRGLSTDSAWTTAVDTLYRISRNPTGTTTDYRVGLQADGTPRRAFGPGLALLPNAGFLNPDGGLPDISWVTVAENNDPSLGGSPVTLHIVQVDRRERYRGAIKTVASDNVFDENLGLRHQADFGANPDELYFEWWYRPDDGSLNVPPPDLLKPGQPNPWKLFPDPTGRRGQGRYQITLKGNPNAPEALLADTWWFVRYRHANDDTQDTNWRVPQTPSGDPAVNFTWAGAGNSDPFNDFDNDGVKDYRAQLAQGWIKRVLDAVNPYETRIRDFEGESPSTVSSMLQQFGARFEGPVALNPAKDVIENVGLIELYETILKRGRDLSIDLSRPLSTPAIANALQLASTRISDFYTILGNEAYTDAQDPTIGFGSDSVEYGSLAPAVFSFQNQMASVIDEELALLRGVDDYFARPVYNRLFWNFTKGEGEAAYAMNYNVSDINQDGFIDEDDAMVLYPQGHGDAWGHYLTALRNQYDLLRHPFFNWVSRSEFYNLQDIVIKVDFLDERKFAQSAAAKAKTGAEIVNLTYRSKYVEDPTAQWQGYEDSPSQKDRSWGVQGWARRAAQGAYFDWVTANALLPSQHPNERLEGIQKVDRAANADIAVISANLNAVQTTFDQANEGQNPLGLDRDALVFDIDPTFLAVGSTAQIGTRAVQGLVHFDQIFERALKALQNVKAVWDNANEDRNRLRQVANSEAEFRNSVFQEDLSYRNQLIKIFGKPYEGMIGPGKLYPAGYDGPDLLLYMYVDRRTMDGTTVPGPTTAFAAWTATTNNNVVTYTVTGGDIYTAFNNGDGGTTITDQIDDDVLNLFAPTFAGESPSILASNGLYNVKYTDLTNPKVNLSGLATSMPVTAAGYTFQAPPEWGKRLAVGELQLQINKMLQQEASIAGAIGEWDGLQGAIVRSVRLLSARLETGAAIRANTKELLDTKFALGIVARGIYGVIAIIDSIETVAEITAESIKQGIPVNLPTAGLAFSPGDALGPARGALNLSKVAFKTAAKTSTVVAEITKFIQETIFEALENSTTLDNDQLERDLAAKEWLVELENLVGDEPIKRIAVFKEVEALRELSDQYRAMLDEGSRLVDERAAFNKRVAAQTQRNRYQDMTFRVSRNHALQTYRSAFEIAARYVYLAAKAYDYETNFDPAHPGAPVDLYSDIVKARSVGLFDGEARSGAGGLSQALAWLKTNFEHAKGQLGINNPQLENGKLSLRTELFRILPAGTDAVQPGELPSPGQQSDAVWRGTLEEARVDDLWMVPEFRYLCQPFAPEADAAGNHVAEPGLVIRFSTEVLAGKNFFGRPLSGTDHAYDPSHYATKINAVGVWFSDYLSSDVLNDLPATPRVYLVPIGIDVMSVPFSDNPSLVRFWKVVDQRIPMPLAATASDLGRSQWIPLLDSLNGRLGEPRRFSMFRAYHDAGGSVSEDETIADSRIVGRSIWNTQWLLIIPGRMLNSDPDVGLERFIQQVTDIKLIFQTYGYSGG